jgi:glycosyltransferase involved in cell wall biosynthesis
MQLLSIVVPIYNTEKYLTECIESIRQQTYSNIEIILVNDGSTDNSFEICLNEAKTDRRIVLINQKNSGLSAARNTGISACSGDYLGFVDSDDFISPNMYEHLYGLITHYNGDIVSGSYVIFDPKNNGFSNNGFSINRNQVSAIVYERSDAMHYYLSKGIEKINDYPAWTKLYKRELFTSVTFPEGKIYEDMATNYNLISKASIYIKTNEIVYYYRKNPKGITSSRYKARNLDLLAACDEIECISLAEKNTELITLAQMIRAKSYLFVFYKMSLSGIIPKPQMLRDAKKECHKIFIRMMTSNMPLLLRFVFLLFCIYPGIFKLIALTKRYSGNGLDE